MFPDLKTETDRLQKQYRRLRLAVFGFIPLLAAAIVCAFAAPKAAWAVLAAAVAYQMLFLRRWQKYYTKEAARVNILLTVGRRLGTDTLDETGGGTITAQEIAAAGLVPVDGGESSCLLRQGLTGTLGALPAAVCDATLGETFHLVENGKKRVHFNAGCWVKIALPADTGANWRLLHPDAVPTLIRQAYYSAQPELEPCEAPGGAPKDFLYYKGEGAAPGSRTLAQLYKLADYTTGQPAVALQGNTLTVFLRGRFVAPAVSFKEAPSGESLSFDPLPELEYLLQLANAVRVDCGIG